MKLLLGSAAIRHATWGTIALLVHTRTLLADLAALLDLLLAFCWSNDLSALASLLAIGLAWLFLALATEC